MHHQLFFFKCPLLPLFVLALVSLSGLRFKRAWSTDQELAANNMIRKYQDAFQFFASIHDEGKGAKRMFEVRSFFSHARDRHYYDLFEDDYVGTSEVDDYLLTILDHYHCNMSVRFEPLGVPTAEQFQGKQYARYIVKKTIKYKGRSKSVTNIIMVDMDRETPKITVVGQPEHFPDGGCQSITTHADRYFNSKNYRKAKELYLARVACSSDVYAQQQVIACNSALAIPVATAEPLAAPPPQEGSVTVAPTVPKADQVAATVRRLEQTADQYHQEANYSAAKQFYQLALEYTPNDSAISQKLANSLQSLAFEQHKTQGDHYYFKEKFFLAAQEQYRLALAIQPDDNYVGKQIQQCEEMHQAQQNSPEALAKRMDEAVSSWNKGKFASCFSLLHPLADSKMLSSVHYFMLGEIAITNRQRVWKKMDWSKTQGLSVGSYYLAEALKDKESKYYLNALKRYCDLRARTIRALKLNDLDCGAIDESDHWD